MGVTYATITASLVVAGLRWLFVALVGGITKRLRRRGAARPAAANGKRSLATALSVGLVDAFEHLGPTWVKIGQVIASSPGMFPPSIADACQRTLDEVPPFDGATARRIISEDLGRAPEDVFAWFDPEPLSAASVGQVHAVQLVDGRSAVVKLQRPGIAQLFEVDFRIMYRLARLLERVPQLKGLNAVALVRDAHDVAFAELNPALEALNQHRFRNNLGAFGDNTQITAPEVYWDYCGPRTICMERLSGIPMDDFEELERRGIDGELVLRRGAKAWIEAVCVHGPFHGDMHAGNIWVLDDGRAAFLDFGIMGSLPEEYREAIKDILFTAMIDLDFTRVARTYRKLGVFPPDIGTDEELGQRLGMILAPLIESGMSGLNLADIIKTSLDLMGSYQGKIPPEMALIVKQLAYIERYTKRLAPEYMLIGDLYLISNIFPDEVAKVAADRGLKLPT